MAWIDPLTSHDLMENIENNQVAKFYIIENAGHYVYADQFKQVNSIIIRTIK